MVSSDHTPAELMVATAAREIQDGEIVFVGMRLPLLAFLLAKAAHAPRAVGLFENGILRDRPASEFLVTMSDGPNIAGALWCTEMREIMALLQRGSVDLGFIGGAQVDRFGNLNTSYIARTRGDSQGVTRLPGSGGSCDIASLANRHILIMTHERRRFVSRVDYITSPGYGEGAGWRERVGLTRGGPSAVITTLGVFRFDPVSREIFLASTHPGVSVDQVKAETGWPLRVGPEVMITPPPTEEELRFIRSYDPQGFWTKSPS